MADDEDAFDSWEEQEDSGVLDKRIGELQIDSTSTSKSTLSNNVVMKELSGRTEYAPQVRILKRDQNDGDSKNITNNTDSQNIKPSKTLEEREAEYAEARQRIFGDEVETTCPEEDGDSIKRPIRLICKSDSPVGNTVLRQPRGPDGTNGFQLER
ncbi:hypothetical protein LOTGIDRAFT_234409 [Lottia gigantea]|uniref:SUZ RNA-binding domain-containing n=1 Tax=Lottia gigantea TaxID=225164 RepID=V4A6G5_LOTGI|nr:hypothetical protein LOTGIDRAFT_234409 [Lottia gigantea]ESO88831.1 hypothetical protein LOTGIDRAFT_234409 [Lottia gigantea]